MMYFRGIPLTESKYVPKGTVHKVITSPNTFNILYHDREDLDDLIKLLNEFMEKEQVAKPL